MNGDFTRNLIEQNKNIIFTTNNRNIRNTVFFYLCPIRALYLVVCYFVKMAPSRVMSAVRRSFHCQCVNSK